MVVGSMDKPYDNDTNGFGRRLSLKPFVGLPDARACEGILEGALEMLRYEVHEIEMVELWKACHEKGLSGFDIYCLVKGLVRKGLGEIGETGRNDGITVMPCSETGDGVIVEFRRCGE